MNVNQLTIITKGIIIILTLFINFRWIWMQFPWGCGSYKSNYSEFITSKYSSATEYMSIEQEKAFTIGNFLLFCIKHL